MVLERTNLYVAGWLLGKSAGWINMDSGFMEETEIWLVLASRSLEEMIISDRILNLLMTDTAVIFPFCLLYPDKPGHPL